MRARETRALIPRRHAPPSSLRSSLRKLYTVTQPVRDGQEPTGSRAQVLAEPRERFAPGRLRRLRVVTRPAVVVEGVIDVGVDDLAESLAVLSHRRLDRRNVLIDAVVAPGVDGEHRSTDSGHVDLRHRNTVERDSRAKIGHAGWGTPGNRAAEAEPDHADAIAARRGLSPRKREPAPE